MVKCWCLMTAPTVLWKNIISDSSLKDFSLDECIMLKENFTSFTMRESCLEGFRDCGQVGGL